MDWDRIEGNWKQVKGKVKEQWGKSSPTTTLTRFRDAANSWRERSRHGMAWRRIRFGGTSMTGTADRAGDLSLD